MICGQTLRAGRETGGAGDNKDKEWLPEDRDDSFG
jgi:hypothetical protein